MKIYRNSLKLVSKQTETFRNSFTDIREKSCNVKRKEINNKNKLIKILKPIQNRV